MHPLKELRTIWSLSRLVACLKPDIVHAVTIKPILYCGWLARTTNRFALVGTIPGLGYVFSSRGMVAGLRRGVIRMGYRVALSAKRVRAVFQNKDDLKTFLEAGLVTADSAALIRGSGVNLREFFPTPEPGGAAKGMAFVGRVPFERRGTRPLTHRSGTDDPDRRTVLRVHCAASGGMECYNAHFSWVEEQARDNIREALPFLNDARAPALLLGDFNQPPERELHTRLREAGWVDAWSWLRGAEAGYTYEANRPRSRIDFAYANARLAGRLAEIHVIGEAYRDPPRLSDHLGLVVTLTLG